MDCRDNLTNMQTLTDALIHAKIYQNRQKDIVSGETILQIYTHVPSLVFRM